MPRTCLNVRVVCWGEQRNRTAQRQLHRDQQAAATAAAEHLLPDMRLGSFPILPVDLWTRDDRIPQPPRVDRANPLQKDAAPDGLRPRMRSTVADAMVADDSIVGCFRIAEVDGPRFAAIHRFCDRVCVLGAVGGRRECVRRGHRRTRLLPAPHGSMGQKANLRSLRHGIRSDRLSLRFASRHSAFSRKLLFR